MHKRSTIWIGLGLTLIVLSAGLTVYNLGEAYNGGRKSQAVVEKLVQTVLITPSAENSEEDPAQEYTEIAYPDFVLNPQMDMPSETVNGHNYIGILTIPVLELELPIQKEWSYPNLRVSPSCYAGSVYLDNMVLCGHNYSTHFGRLRELAAGDQILFTDIDGNEFIYEVAETEILQPDAVEQMTAGGWALTLFTCTPGGATRVTIRCNRIAA